MWKGERLLHALQVKVGGGSGGSEEFKGWWPALLAAYRSVWETAGGCAELTDFGVRFLPFSFSKFPGHTGDAFGHALVVREAVVLPPWWWQPLHLSGEGRK